MKTVLLLSVNLLFAAALVPVHANATSFSILGILGGGPVIGAVSGTTLFGTTPYGGGGTGSGTLFSLSAAGIYTQLSNFDNAVAGSIPNGRLAIDASGNLYGTAEQGGANGGGTVWKFAAGSMTALHGFGGSGDGSDPLQGPTIDASGNIYGATAAGAVATNGNAFRVRANGTYKSLHDFLSGSDGHCPFSGVAVGSSGRVFGTTVGRGFGGNPNGSVWKLSSNGTLTTIYVFQNGTDGEWPDQAPVVDAAGNVYGTTHIQNGNGFAGAVWKIAKGGRFSVLHDFNAGTDGSGPNAPLVLNTDGNLYGATGSGGPGGYGTVFKITPQGMFTVLHAFANGTDGAGPTGNIVNDSSGAIYGGTGSGQVFKIVP